MTVSTTTAEPRMPRVHRLIKKSSELLDAILASPEWDRLINIQRFEIFSADCCVLGQTGYRNTHHGRIPGDGKIKWRSFMDGTEFLDQFALKHPSIVERIGLKYHEVLTAFNCGVPHYYGRSQNEQWKSWLQYRRAMREWQVAHDECVAPDRDAS